MRAPSLPESPRLPADAALGVFAFAWLAFIALGGVLPRDAVGMVARQLLFLAAPPLALAATLRTPVRATLGLTRPRGRALLGAALVGASFWALSLVAVVPLVRALIAEPQRLGALERQLPWAHDGAGARVIAVVMVPAVCEELLLRGALARALVPRLGRALAVVASAALFACLHLPPERMLPAAAFGLVLGVAAVATDGAIPGMVMHAVNNLAVTIVVPALPGLDANVTAHPLPIALLSLALTAAGLTLLAATPRGASE